MTYTLQNPYFYLMNRHFWKESCRYHISAYSQLPSHSFKGCPSLLSCRPGLLECCDDAGNGHGRGGCEACHARLFGDAGDR